MICSGSSPSRPASSSSLPRRTTTRILRSTATGWPSHPPSQSPDGILTSPAPRPSATPPLFAYFERLLSIPASLVDPTIVHLTRGVGYSAPSAIMFQRGTVSASDLALLIGTHLLTRRKLEPTRRSIVLSIIIWSPALLIVDHVHFQYNGLLLGILLILLGLLSGGRDLVGAFAFAVLICSKHLFMVAAPVYFVYSLRHYCNNGGIWRGFLRFLMMAAAVGAVFAAAFGPFLYYGQIQQVLRCFVPFGRGLCHAYWAPNFWVFYIILDKVSAFVLVKLGFTIRMPTASFTGGLVGSSSPFAVSSSHSFLKGQGSMPQYAQS